MISLPLVVSAPVAPPDDSVGFGFYVILGAALLGATLLMRKLFSHHAARSIAGVADDAPDAIAVRIAPAPPFPEDITRIRSLLRDTTPTPGITRYTVPVITATEDALTIADKKLGIILTVPAAAITSVTARVTPIRPKGTLLARRYPSLWVTISHEGSEQNFALTPVTGAYNKVPLKDAERTAERISARLGIARP